MFRATAATAPIRLLALGDSLTAGYGLPQGQGFVPRLQAELAARGRTVQVIDAGVSGDTTAGGLARLDWALAENPQAAIVALGGNDGLRALPPAQSRASLTAILDKLKARGIPVLLAGMLAPPISAPHTAGSSPPSSPISRSSGRSWSSTPSSWTAWRAIRR
ncbi:GDSL-type esterase/lipase family protein [Dankookia sp. P2]|uniref:GDSL-type esterase/lipase family protein n=1 Tax=Dankookia sp. P2 TaxID=3423955 RepID=UPI003D66C0E2